MSNQDELEQLVSKFNQLTVFNGHLQARKAASLFQKASSLLVVLEKDLRAMSIVIINSAKGNPAEVVNQLKDQLTTSLRVYEEKMGEILMQYNSNATDSVELASSSKPSGGSGASGSTPSNASTSGTTPSSSGGNVGGGNDLNTGGFSSNVISFPIFPCFRKIL